MIDLHTYLLFISAAVVLVIVPGPDMAYMLARTVTQGRKAGFLAAAGINTGGYVHVFASTLGLTAILAASSVAFTVVKLLGAGYLIWIGIQAIASKRNSLNLESEASKALNGKAIFWQGFWSDVLNPKVALFFLAFLPQFVDVNNRHMSVRVQLLVLGVSCNIVAISINLVLVFFASAMTNHLRKSRRIVVWLHRVMGSLFVALGLRLANERL